MLSVVINFADLLLAALLVGSMFGVWLIFNPAGLDAGSYIALQQQAIRALNRPLPMLGAATIVVTISAAAIARLETIRFVLLLTAVLCFIVAGVITRLLSQPINAVVMTLAAGSPPANWTGLRDKWWRWHLVRLASGLGGLSLVIAAALNHG